MWCYVWVIFIGACGAVIGGVIAGLFRNPGEGPAHPLSLAFCLIGAVITLLAWHGATSLFRMPVSLMAW